MDPATDIRRIADILEEVADALDDPQRSRRMSVERIEMLMIQLEFIRRSLRKATEPSGDEP